MHALRSGFTIIELLVVMAIMAIVVAFSVTAIQSYAQQQQLRAAEAELVSLFRETKQRTVAAESDTQFGLRLATSSITRFVGDTYDPAAANNLQVLFSGVALTSSFANGVDEIQFARLTGVPSATGTIMIEQIRTGEVISLYLTSTGELRRE